MAQDEQDDRGELEHGCQHVSAEEDGTRSRKHRKDADQHVVEGLHGGEEDEDGKQRDGAGVVKQVPGEAHTAVEDEGGREAQGGDAREGQDDGPQDLRLVAALEVDRQEAGDGSLEAEGDRGLGHGDERQGIGKPAEVATSQVADEEELRPEVARLRDEAAQDQHRGPTNEARRSGAAPGLLHDGAARRGGHGEGLLESTGPAPLLPMISFSPSTRGMDASV